MSAIDILNDMSDEEVTEYLVKRTQPNTRIGASSKGGVYRIWHDVGSRRKFVTGSRWSEVWMRAWQDWPEVFRHLHDTYRNYKAIMTSCLRVAEDKDSSTGGPAEPFERETYEQTIQNREPATVKEDLSPEKRQAFNTLMTSYAQRARQGHCHAD
jgi:hypothetical protein